MINNVSQDKALMIYGKGLNVRDWLYVKKHCYGILVAIEKGRTGEIYNLGVHNEKVNNDIVKINLNKHGKLENSITYVADRKGHDQRYVIDMSKANAEFNWKLTTMFVDASKFMVQRYKNHTNWLNECTSDGDMQYYKNVWKELMKRILHLRKGRIKCDCDALNCRSFVSDGAMPN